MRRIVSESGQALVLCMVTLAVLLGCAAVAVDLGHAYYVKRSLQSSADAAALAGAQELPSGFSAALKAREYSASAGNKNERSNVPGVQTDVEVKCVAVAPCRPVNAVYVTESTDVEMFFAKVFGIDSLSVSARAAACSPCASRPLDIMLVLDRTGSMCMDHEGNSDPSCTDLENAKEGVRTFLGLLDPALDSVGMSVLPPASSSSNRCATPPTNSTYNSTSSVYTVAPLRNDYKSAAGAPLNTSSRLVSTLNCLEGGGVTAYANALEAAQTELNARGRSDAQDVIVFLSDGAANYGPTYYPSTSPYRRQPCRQGVTSAAAIKASGTLVYSIGYDLNALDGGANECRLQSTGNLESPAITAYDAIRQIASGPDEFFNQPGAGELEGIYSKIAGDLAGARLIE
jgi:Putative Flp pilus-assembly TadE/G-like/von Willebrand factor type A domain